MRTIDLTIDNRRVKTEKGKTVLDAALGSGIYIPHLCHHPDLRPVGVCRLCIVEIVGREGLAPSCLTEAAEGMTVRTKTPQVERMRRMALELILSRHPADCTSCSQYLNCELQSIKQVVGISEELRVRRIPKSIPVNQNNPLFVQDFSRCILCGRCVRACHELRGAEVLSFIKQGQEIYVGTVFDRLLAESGCRFCGACVEVCPTGALRDKDELIRGKKRREALVPCKYNCPAGIDVPRYLRLIGEKKYAEATAVIREKVPFPKILGYVCNHPCESVCRRDEVNEAISIKGLKRFAAENDQEELWKNKSSRKPSTGKRVAVIGSGPAGLTAAYYLAKQGNAVTVLEALPMAGGMMRVGIPEYRLPREVLDEEIELIKETGVEIKTNTPIESLDRLLLDEGYDAVLAAVGAHRGQKLPIPGADLEGVLIGTDFLREIHLGRSVPVGNKVVVLGGGNVAFDCARVARRLGAEEVHIACLESRDRLPAAEDEINEGEAEGIIIHPSRTFTKILEDNGQAAGVECLRVASFELDNEGRFQIETIEGSVHILPAETVIFAIGQRPEIPDRFDLSVNERNYIAVDPYSLETSVEGVFAAGDAVTGTASIIEAIAAGRKAAAAIDRYLGGDGLIEESLASEDKPYAWLGPGEGFAGLPRMTDGQEEAVVAESSRCLKCDLRLKMTPVKFWGDY